MHTVVDAITAHNGGAGTLTILGRDGGAATTRSWRALHDRARRMAAVLADAGVGRGTRVGLLGDTSADLVTALQASWLAGAAITVLAPPVGGRSDTLAAVVADAGLTLLVSDHHRSSPRHDIVTAHLPARVVTLPELVRRTDLARPVIPVRPEPDDLAILQYTSGSTRTPTGVPVTHGHLAANIAAIKVALDHDASHPSRMLSWLPLFHDMGLIAYLLLPMSCGCPLVLQSPAVFARRPVGWLEAMSRHRITMSGGPNFAFGLMARLLDADFGPDLDLRSVRQLITGGEPIDAAVMEQFTAAAGRYGLDPSALTAAYGLAESTLAVSVSAPRAGLRVDEVDRDLLESYGRAEPARRGRAVLRLTRTGRPVQRTEVRIVDRHDGQPVGERIVGHVQVRGPSVVGHAWGQPPPPDGSWLHTGDLGYLVDGELVVCGREKDVLFAAGRNVYPQDVEAAACDVAAVRAGGALAFGVTGHHGERLVVAVEMKGAHLDDRVSAVRAAVVDAVLAEVGLAPADVVAVPYGRLPKTTSGKPRRAEARRRYLAGELTVRRAAEPALERSL
jgi:fatty-acyl-CoA synthase